jgi:hypothetical protein
MKINKNCHARHAPESNLHQVEDFPYWKKKKKKFCWYYFICYAYMNLNYTIFVYLFFSM